MYDENNLILNRIFTKNTIKSFIDEHPNNFYYNIVERFVSDIKNKNHGQIISEIYKRLGSKYRNEYFYKNTLLNKLLLGIHSPTTTTVLIEVPVCRSKADFIMINGKATLYEIKTELDTIERLNSQLNDYYKAFPNVCVITCEDNLSLVEKKFGNTNVGISILTKTKNTIRQIKEYIPDYSKLEHRTIFRILRKSEYQNIIKLKFGELPNVSDFDYYEECYKMFTQIKIEDAYNMMIIELKKRNHIDVSLIKSIPSELRGIMYFSKFKEKDYKKLNEFLNKKIGDNHVLSIS